MADNPAGQGPHQPKPDKPDPLAHVMLPAGKVRRLFAFRVDVDQRSRDARLRLEYVERSLPERSLPKGLLLLRILARMRRMLGW
jgi:hypothetical protein